MKNVLLHVLSFLSLAVFAQKEPYICVGLNAGIGANIQQIDYGDLSSIIPGGSGSPFLYKVTTYGYSIPVTVPIMFGMRRWRIGAELSYQYMHQVKQKIAESSTPLSNTADKKISVSYHLIRAGAIFEYDLWVKNKHKLGLAAEFGYYAVLQSDVDKAFFHPPFLYGSLGLRGTYELLPEFSLVYGIGLNVQGLKYQAYYLGSIFLTKPDMFYQPQLTIGIRKDFGLKTLPKNMKETFGNH